MIDYLDTRQRGLTLSLSFLVFMTLVGLSATVASPYIYEWVGIIIGVALILIAIIPHCLGKKETVFYLVSTSLNAVGIGFSISAYYAVTKIPLLPEMAFLPIIAVSLVFLFINILISLFGHKRLFLVLFGILTGLAILAFSLLWAFGFSIFASFATFSLILLVFFLVVTGRTLDRPERVALRDVSFGSFGAFVAVSLIVIAIISEGDAVDGLDLAEIGTRKKKGAKK